MRTVGIPMEFVSFYTGLMEGQARGPDGLIEGSTRPNVAMEQASVFVKSLCQIAARKLARTLWSAWAAAEAALDYSPSPASEAKLDYPYDAAAAP